MDQRSISTEKVILFLILLAVEALFCFTPLGSLPALGPLVATLGMLPVILTGLLLGAGAGALMGLLTGLFALIVWSFMPPVPDMAFVFTPFYALGIYVGNFTSVLISVAPRVLGGAIAGIVSRGMFRVFPQGELLGYVTGAVAGSMTNTLLVLGGIAVFFGAEYSAVAGHSMAMAVATTILTSGVPEAFVAAVVAAVACRPLKRAAMRTQKAS